MTSTSLIIPQYGQQHLTTRLVGQLLQFKTPNVELIIVDDGSPEAADSQMFTAGNVNVVQQPHRGVTAAWNAGANYAKGDVLVFLNNDVIVRGPFLNALIAPLRQESHPTMSGPQLRTEQLVPDTLSPGSPRRVLEGWCMAITRETLDKLQGFDERFRMYFSDTDFQWRLLASHPQAELIAVPDLPVRHEGHVTTRIHPQRHHLHAADHQRFVEKWKG